MKLSDRASNIGESATLRVTRRAAELRAQGVQVVSLGAGEPDFPSPPSVVEAARLGSPAQYVDYAAAQGAIRRASPGARG